jgi:hypothetical protein
MGEIDGLVQLSEVCQPDKRDVREIVVSYQQS